MLRGPRVALRHITQADLPRLQQASSDPQWRGPFLPSRMTSPREIEQRWSEHGFANDDAERLLVVQGIDGSVIGDVVHFRTARYTTAREIGWAMWDVALRGQGLISEAAGLLVDYVFENWPEVNRLHCGMNVANHASRRVAEKCGFQHEGLERGLVFVAGQWADCHRLALLRSEWQALKGG